MSQYPKPSTKYKNVLMEPGYYEAEIIDTVWMQPKQKEGEPLHNNWMLGVKLAITEKGPYFNNKVTSYFNLLHTSPDAMKYSKIAFENLCKAIHITPFQIDTSIGPTREDDEKILFHRVSVHLITDTLANEQEVNRVKGIYALKKTTEQKQTQPQTSSEDPGPENWFGDNDDKIPF
jgi:hypothetical protein